MYKVVVCFRWWSINVQGGCMFQMMEYKWHLTGSIKYSE